MKRRRLAADFATVLSLLLIFTGIVLSIAGGAPQVQGSDSEPADLQQTIDQDVYGISGDVYQSVTNETYETSSLPNEESNSTSETVYGSTYQPTEAEYSEMLTNPQEKLVGAAASPLAVSKSAQGFREVSCSWAMKKEADTQSLILNPGESAVVKYGITAVREPERERTGARGIITIQGADQVNPTDYIVIDQIFISTPGLADCAWAWVPIPGAMMIYPGVAPQIPYEIEINPEQFLKQVKQFLSTNLGINIEADISSNTPILQILNYLKENLNIDLVYQNRVAIIRKSDLTLSAYSQQPFVIPTTATAKSNTKAILTDNVVCPAGFAVQGDTSIMRTLTGSEVVGYAVSITNVDATGGPYWLVNQAVLQPEGQTPIAVSARVALGTSQMIPSASLNIVKMGDHLVAKSPSIIKYGYKITNTGNVPFAKVLLTDNKCPVVQPALFCNLGVGESVYATAIYPVTPLTPPGDLTNTATATGFTAPDLAQATKGGSVSGFGMVAAQASWTVRILPLTGSEAPGLSLDVAADKAVARPGETVNYYYKIRNTGDFDLQGLTLVDNKFGSIDLPVSDLNIGQEFTVAKSHVISTSDGTGTFVNIGTLRARYLLVKEMTAVDDAFVVITTDNGGGSGGGGGGGSGGLGSPTGDGPSADYGQGGGQSAESVSAPSESLVGGPITVVTPSEPMTLSVPQDPNVKAPRLGAANKGELPFTGGKPLAFEMLGLAMLVLSLAFREPNTKNN